MAKVINIGSKLEETEFVVSAEEAKDVLSYLMDYKPLERSSMCHGEHWMVSQLIRIVENNSGIKVSDIIRERNAK